MDHAKNCSIDKIKDCGCECEYCVMYHRGDQVKANVEANVEAKPRLTFGERVDRKYPSLPAGVKARDKAGKEKSGT